MAVRPVWFTLCFVHSFLTDSVTLQSVHLQEKGATAVGSSAFSFLLATFTS